MRSRDVVIANTKIIADKSSPNTDGIEPMWTSNVHVRNVSISNGDDCITIKSGSHDIVVEDVDCRYSHGITIGSVWWVRLRLMCLASACA